MRTSEPNPWHCPGGAPLCIVVVDAGQTFQGNKYKGAWKGLALFMCSPCLLFSNHQGQGWVHSLKNNTAQTALWWGQTNYMHGMGVAAFVYLRRKASIVS